MVFAKVRVATWNTIIHMIWDVAVVAIANIEITWAPKKYLDKVFLYFRIRVGIIVRLGVNIMSKEDI